MTQGRVYIKQELSDEEREKSMAKLVVVKDTKGRAAFVQVVRRMGLKMASIQRNKYRRRSVAVIYQNSFEMQRREL